MKRILQRPWVQAVLARALVLYLRFALGSTRWTLIGTEHLGLAEGRPAVIALWHARLALLPALLFAVRRTGATPAVSALVSRHRDGRFIGTVMQRFGLVPVHGSTGRDGRDKGGSSGLRGLLRALAEGQYVALTPDGPRGPAGVPAAGMAQLAALAGVPVVPCAAQLRWHIRLPSWDRMIFPLPFGRGRLVCGAPIAVPRLGWEGSLSALKAGLDRVTAQADAGR